MSARSFWTRLTSGEPLILDGAMGTEIARVGPGIGDGDWVGANLGKPDLVAGIHAAYAAAGARVHIANTFATGRHVLETVGLGDRFAEINAAAVRLCRGAVEGAAPGPHWIAGSISTYTVGSDRTGLPAEPALRANVLDQARLLVEAGCDLIALEMLFDAETTLVMARAALEIGVPVSLGFTVHADPEGTIRLRGLGTGRGRDFETDLRAVLSELADAPRLVVTVMHSDLAPTEAAVDIVQRHWRGPVAVYPNAGRLDIDRYEWNHDGVFGPDAFARWGRERFAQGVGMVGGCCGVDPTHIAALSAG
jgi:methionine synthase I (cobalamin-dependent)